jgi:hypothetical protein
LKTREWIIEDGGWPAQSVLDCGGKRSATPLSDATGTVEKLRRRCALMEQSKAWRLWLACFLFSVFCLRSWGQTYSVDWYKIAGGGGPSTGGTYQVSGTIGQPEASGSLSGGNYSVMGGFWSLINVVQMPGAPMLGIRLTTTNTAMVYWLSPATGYNLQVNASLATTNWGVPAETVQDDGTIKFVIINPPTGSRFFRLKNP